ncbi:hypothetical protein P879_11063, partial [Paragonimus westermani]
SRAFTPAGFDQSDGYRTIATTNLHREVHTSGAPSPYPGTHHSPYYDSNTRSSEQRYHTVQHTGQQIRATTGLTGLPQYLHRLEETLGHDSVCASGVLAPLREVTSTNNCHIF